MPAALEIVAGVQTLALGVLSAVVVFRGRQARADERAAAIEQKVDTMQAQLIVVVKWSAAIAGFLNVTRRATDPKPETFLLDIIDAGVQGERHRRATDPGEQ